MSWSNTSELQKKKKEKKKKFFFLFSSCVKIWQNKEKGSRICAACKCNQRQSDDTHSEQIMQQCFFNRFVYQKQMPDTW